MYLVYRIEVKQVCTSLEVADENKGQQNMKAETAFTKISKTWLTSPNLDLEALPQTFASVRITFLVENTVYRISKNK